MDFYMGILIQFILNEYFADLRCVLNLSDNSDLEYKSLIPCVNIEVKNGTFDPKLIFRKYHGCQGILINTASPRTTMEFMEEQIRLNNDRFHHRRYIIISRSDAFNIFDSKSIEFIADLILIIPKNKEIILDKNVFSPSQMIYQIYTHAFIGFNKSTDVVLLDEWNSGCTCFVNNVNLFPEKLKNGFGRIFTIATITYKPNSIPATRDGSELRVGIAFCEYYNLTVDLYIDEEGEFGEIYDNWTGYGILGNVLKDYGDIGFGSVFSWEHEYYYLDFTKPVYRSGVTTIAPAPVLISNWLLPTYPFSVGLWIGVTITFVFCSVVLFLFNQLNYSIDGKRTVRLSCKGKLPSLLKGIFDTISMFLMQAINDNKQLRYNNKQFIYGGMLAFSILIASSYSSGLASCLTVPRYTNPIRSTRDLIDANIHWGATSIAWIMSIMYAPEENYVILTERFLEANKSVLETYNNKDFAYAIERLPGGSYAIGDYVTEEGISTLRLMDEDIYFEYCVFMIKKSSIWLDQLDTFMLLISQTGLQHFWEKEAVNKYMNTNIQRAVRYSLHINIDGAEVPLPIDQLQGIFGILFLGWLSAFVCFILELYIYSKSKNIIRL